MFNGKFNFTFEYKNVTTFKGAFYSRLYVFAYKRSTTIYIDNDLRTFFHINCNVRDAF